MSAKTADMRIIEKGKWTIGRLWRLIGTGLSFSLFGIGGLVMALIWFPFIGIFIRNPDKRAEIAQLSVHKIWRIYIEIMRLLGVLTYDIDCAEQLRNARGTVVVANHPSLIDIVFLMAFMRRTRAVVKKGVWNNPFMSGVVKACNYIPNLGDPKQLISDCADALREGANLCIFPEGSRTPEHQKAVYQRGFAHIALDADAPILMISITVTPPTLRKHEPWYSIPLSRPHFQIRLVDVIETYNNPTYEAGPVGVRKLTDYIQNRIEEELRH